MTIQMKANMIILSNNTIRFFRYCQVFIIQIFPILLCYTTEDHYALIKSLGLAVGAMHRYRQGHGTESH